MFTEFNWVKLDERIYPWIIIMVSPINALVNPYIYCLSEYISHKKFVKISKLKRM